MKYIVKYIYRIETFNLSQGNATKDLSDDISMTKMGPVVTENTV